jgi:hypothetical protein
MHPDPKTTIPPSPPDDGPPSTPLPDSQETNPDSPPLYTTPTQSSPNPDSPPLYTTPTQLAPEPTSRNPSSTASSTTSISNTSALKQGTKGVLILFQTNGFDRINAHIQWKSTTFKLMLLPHFDDIVSLLIHTYWAKHATNLPGGNKELKLPIFTEYNRDGTVFRAHNNYRSKGPWHDWCWIEWDTTPGIAKVLIFVEPPEGGLSAIVFPCDPTRKRWHSVLCDRWTMEMKPRTKRPWLQIITTDGLERHALMLPYNANEWLNVRDRCTWSDNFHVLDTDNL